MNATANRKDLADTVGAVLGFATRTGSMPILSTVLLSADESTGILVSATDLEIGATADCEAVVSQPGKVAVTAKMLYAVLKSLPDETVELADEGATLVLKSGASEFKLATQNADDFPGLPSAAEVAFSDISAPLLADMLGRVGFAVSTDESRYMLNGVHLETRPGRLFAAATDGHRLAQVEREGEFPAELPANGITIPRRAAAELLKVMERVEGEVGIGLHKNSLYLRAPGLTMSARLIDGEFPDPNAVIPESTTREAIIDTEFLVAALKRASVLSQDKAWGIRFDLKGDGLEINSSNPNVGDAHDKLDLAEYRGEPLNIGFNPRYVLDALSVIDCEHVRVRFDDELRPCIVQAAEDDGYLCVVMPMRI